MKREIIERIAAIISSIVEEIDIKALEPDADLQQIGMDSFEFVRIIVTIEDEFEIEFPDEYLLVEQMNTLDKIAELVLLCGDDKKQ